MAARWRWLLVLLAFAVTGCKEAEQPPVTGREASPTTSSTASTATRVAAATVTPLPATRLATPPPVPPTPPSEPVTLPQGGTPALVVRKGDPARKVVAFSFDAGADAGFAPQILDTLAANGIHASFGITGRWAEQNAELLRRVVRDGHLLINHTYDHASMTGAATRTPPLTREQRWEELDRTEAIVQQLTGATTKPYFRPPYGAFDDSVNEDAGARGYAFNVLWSVDSRGWMGWSAGAIIQGCLQQAEPGAIYVFHVGSQSQDGPALQAIIDGLHAEGYFIGSVPDVLPR